MGSQCSACFVFESAIHCFAAAVATAAVTRQPRVPQGDLLPLLPLPLALQGSFLMLPATCGACCDRWCCCCQPGLLHTDIAAGNLFTAVSLCVSFVCVHSLPRLPCRRRWPTCAWRCVRPRSCALSCWTPRCARCGHAVVTLWIRCEVMGWLCMHLVLWTDFHAMPQSTCGRNMPAMVNLLLGSRNSGSASERLCTRACLHCLPHAAVVSHSFPQGPEIRTGFLENEHRCYAHPNYLLCAFITNCVHCCSSPAGP